MSIEEIQARRAERKERMQAEEIAQKGIDLARLDELEVEHGDTSVRSIEIPFTAGLPTMLVVRCPKPPEIKRYRARVKPDKDGGVADYAQPAEELGLSCLVYPDADTYAKMCLARPGISTQAGLAAMRLASGRDEAEGKG